MDGTLRPITAVIQPLPGIGDMIWHLPALQALAAQAPDGKLTLFTKASSLPEQLLAGESWFAKAIYLPKGRGLFAVLTNFLETWRAIARNRPDRLYIFHQSARYRWAARLAGVRKIIAYPKELATSKVNGWEKSLAFLDQMHISVPSRHSQLHIAAEARRIAEEKFSAYPKPWFAVACGAADAKRRWPTERFAQCADAVIEILGGTLFLTGSVAEAPRIAEVQGQCRHKDKIVPAAGINFQTFLGLIEGCCGILGNDSGPINVAAALGKPAFVICGVSKPAPHSSNLIIIQAKDMQLTQIMRSDLAMSDLGADRVIEVLRDYFAQQGELKTA